MHILWLTNVVLPEASILWNEKPTPFGGWLVHASKMLAKQTDIQLSILFPKQNTNQIIDVQGELIHYYGFNSSYKTEKELEYQLLEVLDKTKPDIVHIYGTEYKHSYVMIKLCNQIGIKVVTSIQGLISIYATHFGASLPPKIQLRYTLRDLLKNNNLMKQQKEYIERGTYELKTIQLSKHIIGRTSWDYACIKEMNSDATYHHCNETLRESFYSHQWDLKTCEKFTIFASQAYYPIKGLHMLLEAMKIVVKHYPESKLYISGENVFTKKGLFSTLKMSSFSKYINDFIKNNSLENHLVYTGILDENQMIERFLKSHIFVLPSAIENSPNSIGEAMIMGVPTIASYVGGVMDLVNHKKDGFLYPFDAPYMLAHYIMEIFSKNELAEELSKQAKQTAQEIHDPENNLNQLLTIYHHIISK